jgi:mono/diheme cytochrome c family protein
MCGWWWLHIAVSIRMRLTRRAINRTYIFMKTLPIIENAARAVLSAAVLLAVCGCEPQKSARGFRLPDGNVDRGREAFVSLQCNSCHTVVGENFPAPERFNIRLGGETARIRTYGDLVTSIINPSHVITARYVEELREAKESPMTNFNETMTVAQMIDLVAFLQSRYELIVPEQRMPYYPW